MPPDPEEWILRRVHKSRCSEGQPIQVLKGGVSPNDKGNRSPFFLKTGAAAGGSSC